MTTVYLIRHAEAEGNLYRRCHGHYNSTVTARGYRQIAALAGRFAHEHFDAVYSSDRTRTQTTALAIARVHDLPLRTDPRLREIGVGPWEDRTWTWLGKFDRERLVQFNTRIAQWHVDGGEDMAVVRERTLAALRDIIAAHPDQTVAVVSHGMALRTLTGTLQGLSLEDLDRTGHAENTAVTKLEADGEDDIRVVYRDDATHLPEELTTLHRQLWTKTKNGLEPGIWFEPDGSAEGRFRVVREDEYVGAVAVKRGESGVAEIEEFRLDEAIRGRGLGIRLIGQAISYARPLGCDTLRVEAPKNDAAALRRAAQYGFSAAGETPQSVALDLYFGNDERYRRARFDEAWAEWNEKNDG